MPLLTHNTLVLAKAESTYGTDPVPTAAANAIETAALGLRMVTQQGSRIDLMNGLLSPAPPVLERKHAELTFSTELKGSGATAPTTEPALGILLKGCGFTVATAGGPVDTHTYTPLSTGFTSLTFYVFKDGKRWVIRGARGTAVLRFPTGARPMVDWTFLGYVDTPTDVATPTPTLESTLPVPVKGATATLDSYAAKWATLSVDLGNTVTPLDSPSNADGYSGFDITGRNITGRIDPEAVLMAEAGWSYWADYLAATELALSLVLGATAGNIFTMSASQVVVGDFSEPDRNGVVVNDLPLHFGRSAGNDEISFVWT